MTIYALVVFLKSCGIPCSPIFVDPRPMTYTQCRQLREPTMWHYRLENTEVWVVCIGEDNNGMD